MKIHAEIKKWGNGLGLRVTGAMRDIPALKAGTKVDVEITEEGLIIKKTKKTKAKRLSFPYTEEELLEGITPENIHAELLPKLTDAELWD